jgi:hypothetical protein
MRATGGIRRPWALALVCVQLAWPAARTAGAGEASPATTPESGEAPPLATVWFLPAASSDPFTFFIEIDARRHLVPAPASPARQGMVEPLRFEPLCVGPCSVRLPHGTYSIAVSRPGGNATTKAALSVTRDVRVVGHYHSACWRRVLGTTVIATSASLGSLFMLPVLFGHCYSECVDYGPSILLGLSILVAGTLSAVVLIATGRDVASLE